MNIDKDNIDILLTRIQQDDIKAYNQLYALFFAPLCVFASRFLSDESDRQDCVQDVFMKIWTERKTLNINTSIRSYLLVATKNKCLNIIEKKNVKESYQQHIINTYDPYSDDDLYSAKELKSCIQKALSSLPEKYRTVFKMSRFENMTYKQIAESKNISIKTVEAYISKSLSILNENLKDFFSILF